MKGCDLVKALASDTAGVYNQTMRYEITQRRNNGPEVILGETRRYNGALSIQEFQHFSAVEHLRAHAHGARVVQGPAGEDAVAVVMINDASDYTIVTSVRRKVRAP